MVSVLADDWVYLDIDGKTDIYGLQEAQRVFKSKNQAVKSAFLDYQIKIIPLLNEQRSSNDLIKDVFDNNSVIVHENISEGQIQLIAAKKERIKEIYQYFNGVQVGSLVPYGAAIRAILKSKNLLNQYPYIIFLDDMKGRPTLTFYEGMRFSAPRRFNMVDISYIILEIKRSLQGFISEGAHKQDQSEVSFVLISNNKHWNSDLIAKNFLPKEQILYLDIEFPALEGLKEARFTLHFALAEEILKQKRMQLWKSRIKTIAASVFLILVSLGIYLIAILLERKEQVWSQALNGQMKQYKIVLENLYQRKLISLMKQDGLIEYEKVYFNFVRAVPENYLIDSFNLKKEKEGGWGIEAIIYPENEKIFPSNFKRQLFYPNAQLFYVVTHKVTGQKIKVSLKNEEVDI